ncbi:hypothetical protein [Psychrobacter sp. P11G5]|uniref:hypothetical protein n=1 Tax=unclassified Psychrobacter TaxID=196806 RepID=UPI000A9A4809|nr:hypothetical protein [Psychrobacter sp. P11G5]
MSESPIVQALWTVFILSAGIVGSVYALSLWGESLSQILMTTDKHFWYSSHASGVIAYALFWLAVVFGLLLSTRLCRYFNATKVFALH